MLTAGPKEPSALLDVSRDAGRRQPNMRATVQEVFDGARIASQSRWPSLSFDVSAVNDAVSPFFAAGFYYKTFMWPKAAWHKLYETMIRKAAGLGVAPEEEDPDHYANGSAHCDVLIAGAGVDRLADARSAALASATVITVEEQPGGAAAWP